MKNTHPLLLLKLWPVSLASTEILIRGRRCGGGSICGPAAAALIKALMRAELQNGKVAETFNCRNIRSSRETSLCSSAHQSDSSLGLDGFIFWRRLSSCQIPHNIRVIERNLKKGNIIKEMQTNWFSRRTWRRWEHLRKRRSVRKYKTFRNK